MKISHNLILKESLIELLEEVYDSHSQSQVVNATTNLSRCMKCVELDVKLLLKMSLSFEPKATDNNEENIFIHPPPHLYQHGAGTANQNHTIVSFRKSSLSIGK
jgi:hypothetical protein